MTNEEGLKEVKLDEFDLKLEHPEIKVAKVCFMEGESIGRLTRL